MESKKNWEEYTEGEKTTLLNHWFYYYGGVIMTLKDIEDFRKISETRQDDIFNHIVTNYIYRNTIQSNMLVSSMRQNKTDELFQLSITKDQIAEGKEDIFEEVRKDIADEIIKTFISPEPPVPMDIAIVVEEGPKKSKTRNNKKGKK